MVKTVLILGLAALLVGCRKESKSPASSVERITGTWSFSFNDVNGHFSTGTNVLLPTGSFHCTWVSASSNHIYTNTIQGTFEVAGSTLVETVTNHSDPEARVPYVLRSRIVHLDERSMHLEPERAETELVIVYNRAGN